MMSKATITQGPRKILLVAFISWVVGCTVIGIVASLVDGKHEFIWAILGGTVGLCGATAHCGLICFTPFLRLAEVPRIFVLWLTVVFIFLVVAAILFLRATAHHPWQYSFAEGAHNIFFHVVLPVLFAAAVFNHLVGRFSAA